VKIKVPDGGSDESKHATHFRMPYLYYTSPLRVTDEFQAAKLWKNLVYFEN
jgi:hypothetical protein